MSSLPAVLSDRIPLEVTDYIIEFLWSDSRSLYACARTCKLWSHRSLFLLYDTLHIDHRGMFDHLAKCVMHAPEVINRLRKVRHLVISESGDESYAAAVPYLLGSHITTLESIHMSGRFASTVHHATNFRPHHTFFLSMAQFASITKLKLAFYTFCNFSDLRRLLSALSSIKDLHLGALDSWNSHVPTNNSWSKVPRLQLRSLVLRHVTPSLMIPLLNWIVYSQHGKKTLRHLQLEPSFDDSTWQTSTHELLQMLGESLHHLSLPCRGIEHSPSLLYSCSLRSLRIILAEWYPYKAYWKRVTEMISEISSPHISHLTLEVLCEDVLQDHDLLLDDLQDSADHKAFTQLLRTNTIFDCLQTVRVKFFCYFAWDVPTFRVNQISSGLEYSWKNLLAPWHSRGITKFSREFIRDSPPYPTVPWSPCQHGYCALSACPECGASRTRLSTWVKGGEDYSLEGMATSEYRVGTALATARTPRSWRRVVRLATSSRYG